jgi:fused signal recognition particle receptor
MVLGFFKGIKEKLARTHNAIASAVEGAFTGVSREEALSNLEEALILSDVGVTTAMEVVNDLRGDFGRWDMESVKARLRDDIHGILKKVEAPIAIGPAPHVIMVLGVNGVGKTTTIGKIAAKLRAEGKRVLLGAGDTFRAAAVEQLVVWGERAGAPVVRGKEGSDPSSVIFDAIKRGIDENFDVVICDTAGRLHTKVDLMEELKKVGRVCNKALEGAPHETWLVLDATTGQNAIQQAQMFKEAMNITGFVLTKLDGTAKGGVILGICDELRVPVRYIGIGESVSDLREFDPRAFASALYAHAESPDAA